MALAINYRRRLLDISFSSFFVVSSWKLKSALIELTESTLRQIAFFLSFFLFSSLFFLFLNHSCFLPVSLTPSVSQVLSFSVSLTLSFSLSCSFFCLYLSFLYFFSFNLSLTLSLSLTVTFSLTLSFFFFLSVTIAFFFSLSLA